MARDSFTRLRHVRRLPGIPAPCALCTQHVSSTATPLSYQTLSFALAQMACCHRDALPPLTAADGDCGVAIGVRLGLETGNVQRCACSHATSGAARLAAYGALEYVIRGKIHAGEEMILDLDTDAWNMVQHFPPDKDYQNTDVTGRIVYPQHDDRRRYLWPMIVDDVNGEKTLFVYGPHFTPTVYFHLTQRDCIKLRWGLMTRRDKFHAWFFFLAFVFLMFGNIVMSILWLTRR